MAEWTQRVLGGAQVGQGARHLLHVAPAIVLWIADDLDDNRSGTGALEKVLIDAIQSTSQPGTLGEVLRGLEPLGDLLVDEMRSEISESSPGEANEIADVTRRLHQALAKIHVAVAEIVDSRSRAQIADARVRLEEFVRHAVHEIKNPLGAAELALRMVRDDEVVRTDQEREKYLRMIERNLVRGRQLLQELRERALPDPDAEETDAWSDLTEILDEVLHEVSPAAAAGGVQIEIRDPETRLEVPEYSARLALANLLWNAVKYADTGKHERWVKIQVQPSEVEGVWLVRVEDNGIGVSENLHERVFERFFRAAPERADGSGLGLAIAREAVEESGGGLWLRSEQGVGSVFTVALPVRSAIPVADVEAPRLREVG